MDFLPPPECGTGALEGSLGLAGGKRLSVACTNHLCHIAAGESGGRQTPARNYPMAGHVEALQSRQRIGNAPAQDARGRQPAFVTALPVAGIAEKGSGGRDVRPFEVLGQSRKPIVEDADDFPNERPFFCPVSQAIILFEMGPVFRSEEHTSEL